MFRNYRELLQKWGSVSRLVGSTDPAWIVEYLLLDSLLFLRVLPPGVRSLLDFGAGAGIPGIPIKIMRPQIELSLLESRRRRASFLTTAVRELRLSGARVIQARGEDIVDELGKSFDAVVMRCAGHLPAMLPLAAQFAAPGGIVIAAGPPRPFALTVGRWLQVPGVREGTTRRFAVFSEPGR